MIRRSVRVAALDRAEHLLGEVGNTSCDQRRPRRPDLRERLQAGYPASAGPFAELQAILRGMALDLSRFDDPHGVYAFAFIDVD